MTDEHREDTSNILVSKTAKLSGGMRFRAKPRLWAKPLLLFRLSWLLHKRQQDNSYLFSGVALELVTARWSSFEKGNKRLLTST